MNSEHKALPKIMQGLIIFCTLAVIYFLYLLLYPVNPITINHVGIVNPKLKSTDVLVYRFDYCKHTDKGALVYRQIFSDEKTIPFPAVTSVVKPGCDVVDIPLQLIPGTSAGKYRLRGVMTFKVNTIKSVDVNYVSDQFEIIQ